MDLLGEYEGETLNLKESNKLLKQNLHERQGKQITIQQIQLSWT